MRLVVALLAAVAAYSLATGVLDWRRPRPARLDHLVLEVGADVGDLPAEAVRVLEVARPATPVAPLRGLHRLKRRIRG